MDKQDDEPMTRCALCRRYRVDDAWISVAEPVEAEAPAVCPDCLAALVARPIPPRLLLALHVGP
jgi:hypothetical protein